MDRPDCDVRRLGAALDGLDRVHRLTGGHRLLSAPLLRSVRNIRKVGLLLLDVGTGGGEGAARVRRRLTAEGHPSCRAVLADLHPATIRLARERRRAEGAGAEAPGAYRFVRLDAARLPFPDRAFDLACSATTLHHLEREEAVSFLGELDRVSGGRWVVTDLRRSRLALAAVRLLAATLWRNNPFPRSDGPLSVRRSFTPDELAALLTEAGLDEARVDRAGPVRMRAVGGGLRHPERTTRAPASRRSLRAGRPA